MPPHEAPKKRRRLEPPSPGPDVVLESEDSASSSEAEQSDEVRLGSYVV